MGALAFACLSSSLALESRSGIQLRIHAPFADLYSGEMDYWLVRVENRGDQAIPVPNGSAGLTDEVPPPQFHVQTEAEVRLGNRPPVSSWEEIQSFGYGMKEMVDKSVLEPGQAMEAFSWGLPGQLATPPQGGTFRIAMQVGPDDFVYSNWIVRTRYDEPVPGMRTLHVGDPWGNGSECQIRISEDTSLQYLWFSAGGQARSSLFRVCEVPEGVVPDIRIDQERGQYVISFPQVDSGATYFGHRCGISKATPWPKNYRSRDFLLTPYPASAPSPIGFPMALFQQDPQTEPDHEESRTTGSERSGNRVSKAPVSHSDEHGNAVRFAIWFAAGMGVVLAGAVIAFLRKRK